MLVSTPFFLSSCTSDLPSDASPEKIVNSFLPNLWVFLANLVAVVVLLIIFSVFAWKPTKRILNERNRLIQNEINSAKNLNQAAQKLKAEVERLKLEAYQKADTIVYDAQFSAYNQKKEIINSAKNLANEIIISARREIVRENNELRQQIKNEMTDVVFIVAEQLLSRNITREDNEKMVTELIKKINDKSLS